MSKKKDKDRYGFPSEANKAIAFIYVCGKFVATPELREKYAKEGKGGLALEYRAHKGSEYGRQLMHSASFSDAAEQWFKSKFKFAEVKPGRIGVVKKNTNKNVNWDGEHLYMAEALKDIKV